MKDSHTQKSTSEVNMNRRTFTKLAVAGALGGEALFSLAGKAHGKVQPLEPGIKIAVQSAINPGPDEFLFYKQLGVKYACVGTGGDQATLDTFKAIRKRYEDQGMLVWNIGNSNVHNMEEVTLNLPRRDEKIAEYLQFLRNIGQTGGIYYTTYAHMGNGIWSTGRETIRDTPGRAFELDKAVQGSWGGKNFVAPLTHGRKYSEQEIWDNYTYFIKKVVPVAEEVGIRIGIHPDDPPAKELGGVPRCIFGNFDGYKRALEIADSPNVGMCLCVGCWLEGGPLMGKDVIDTIHYFGERKKLFKIHFRNVNAPLPHFVETYMDNGYMNMHKIMRALREVNFDGIVIADHIPGMRAPGGGGNSAGLAYSIAYMRALIEEANQLS
jgi:mannonate dehydratase